MPVVLRDADLVCVLEPVVVRVTDDVLLSEMFAVAVTFSGGVGVCVIEGVRVSWEIDCETDGDALGVDESVPERIRLGEVECEGPDDVMLIDTLLDSVREWLCVSVAEAVSVAVCVFDVVVDTTMEAERELLRLAVTDAESVVVADAVREFESLIDAVTDPVNDAE